MIFILIGAAERTAAGEPGQDIIERLAKDVTIPGEMNADG